MKLEIGQRYWVMDKKHDVLSFIYEGVKDDLIINYFGLFSAEPKIISTRKNKKV